VKRLLILAIAALSMVAPAIASAQPVSTSGCAKVSPLTDATDIAGLQADADCYGAAAAADTTLIDTINEAISAALAERKARLDRIVDLMVPKWLPSPSMNGLPAIASNFDTNTAMTPAAIPPVEAPTGAFRFNCGPGQLLYDDPIVFPGQPGKSHLHQFYGNTAANAYSTYESLRSTGGSTCNFTGGATALNRSGYWMPAMLDGKGNVVRPDYTNIYYKRRPSTDPVVSCWEKAPSPRKCEGIAAALPNGLRFIAGWDPTGKTAVRTGSAWFNCSGGVNGHYTTIEQAAPNCPAGSHLETLINFPECWDGKNLDSPDHRSHVAYATYTAYGYLQCPETHPRVIPTFTLAAFYSVQPGDDLTQWQFSSDAMAPGQPHGFTYHADWFGAWDPVALAGWHAGCIEKMLNCNSGNMGNGKQLLNASIPHYVINGKTIASWVVPTDQRLVPLASLPVR
jgi:hypothetical protein